MLSRRTFCLSSALASLCPWLAKPAATELPPSVLPPGPIDSFHSDMLEYIFETNGPFYVALHTSAPSHDAKEWTETGYAEYKRVPLG